MHLELSAVVVFLNLKLVLNRLGESEILPSTTLSHFYYWTLMQNCSAYALNFRPCAILVIWNDLLLHAASTSYRSRDVTTRVVC